MLQRDHSAILSTFIKLPFVIKIFVCLFLSIRFTQVLLYVGLSPARVPIDSEINMSCCHKGVLSTDLLKTMNWIIPSERERSGSVVECLTRDEGPRVRASPVSLRCGP